MPLPGPAYNVSRKVDLVYTTITKVVLWRVTLEARPVTAAPGWVWPEEPLIYVGTGDSMDHADTAAINLMKAALG